MHWRDVEPSAQCDEDGAAECNEPAPRIIHVYIAVSVNFIAAAATATIRYAVPGVCKKTHYKPRACRNALLPTQYSLIVQLGPCFTGAPTLRQVRESCPHAWGSQAVHQTVMLFGAWGDAKFWKSIATNLQA